MKKIMHEMLIKALSFESGTSFIEIGPSNVPRKKGICATHWYQYKRHNAAILVPSHVNVDMLLTRKGE